jgi:SAM-dependent methyltransferase
VSTTAATGPVDEASRYTFPTSDEQGLHQLRLLGLILDDHSTDVLVRAGIEPGWQVLDVGAGAGTVTMWLAREVGPSGHVTALDLDPRFTEDSVDTITVRQGDVRTATLPMDHYDLIHIRLVLVHLAEREQVLDRLVAALKPGGRLVVSDWDATRHDWLLRAPSPAHAEAFDAFQTGLLAILEANGADPGWARRAPLAMQAAGLVDVETVIHNRSWKGCEPGCLLHEANSRLLHDALLARGVTVEQLDRLGEAMRHPDTLAYCYSMFTTVGRRPEN